MMALVSLLLPLLLGLSMLIYFRPGLLEKGFVGSFALAYGLGSGLLTFVMFLFALASIPFSLLLFVLLQVFLVLLFSILTWKKRKYSQISVFNKKGSFSGFLKGKSTWISCVLLGWIFMKFILVLNENILWPIHAWDSWENWSSGAKYFFLEKGLNLDKSSEYFFGGQYRTFLAYPLHIPLMQVWVSMCLGGTDEALMKIWSSFYFIAATGLVYFFVKEEANHISAIISSALLAGVPLLSYHASSSYADLPLAYFSLAATVCIWAYIKAQKNKEEKSGFFLVLIGFFSAMCIWTKTEGLFFALSNIFVLAVYMYRQKRLIVDYLALLAPIILIALPWYLFLFINEIKLGRGNFLVSGLHPEVFPLIWEQIMFSANFNLIFPFFFLMLGISFLRILRTDIKYLVSSIVLIMLQYLFVYLTTENYLFVMNLSAINRNIMTFIPSMYYICALLVIHEINNENPISDRGV